VGPRTSPIAAALSGNRSLALVMAVRCSMRQVAFLVHTTVHQDYVRGFGNVKVVATVLDLS
jgi:hypothetical protein